MNKAIVLPILFVFFLSLAVSSNAQEEFTAGTFVFAGQNLHDPKVACHPNGDHCLLAFYDSSTTKIHFKYSWRGSVAPPYTISNYLTTPSVGLLGEA